MFYWLHRLSRHGWSGQGCKLRCGGFHVPDFYRRNINSTSCKFIKVNFITRLTYMTPTRNNEVVISISDLTKSFDDNNVLNGINLELHKGENVVIMGRSGSGKSVLIKIIAGLLK